MSLDVFLVGIHGLESFLEKLSELDVKKVSRNMLVTSMKHPS